MYTYVHIMYTYVHLGTLMYTYVHLCTLMYTYMYTYVHIMYTCVNLSQKHAATTQTLPETTQTLRIHCRMRKEPATKWTRRSYTCTPPVRYGTVPYRTIWYRTVPYHMVPYRTGWRPPYGRQHCSKSATLGSVTNDSKATASVLYWYGSYPTITQLQDSGSAPALDQLRNVQKVA